MSEMLEKILSDENIRLAQKRVYSNKGAGGVDGVTTGELEEYMTAGPSVMLALGGENAIAKVRAINGATNPAKAEPGTLRYDFAPSMTENVVHSSDSPESAAREISFWFKESDVYSYEAPGRKACCVMGK